MNNIIKENERNHIIRKTGRYPKECKCKLCKHQCHTPCIGTPSDILRLVNAGYSDRLSFTDWAAGVIMGCTDHVIKMIQATKEGEWCTFYHDGLCELHDKGLKPTEGVLSHHSIAMDKWKPKKSISWNVAKTWEDEENKSIIEEITSRMLKKRNKMIRVMTNEKKAESLSYYHCTRGTCNGKECEGCEYAKADDAVLAMAELKDEQFTKQKQALIDKACEWLGKNAFNFDYINVNGEIMKYFFEDFRKAMEETK